MMQKRSRKKDERPLNYSHLTPKSGHLRHNTKVLYRLIRGYTSGREITYSHSTVVFVSVCTMVVARLPWLSVELCTDIVHGLIILWFPQLVLSATSEKQVDDKHRSKRRVFTSRSYLSSAYRPHFLFTPH
jgi:hypothetical protein